MAVEPLIATEPIGPNDHIVGQSLGDAPLNPTDENLRSAGIAVVAIVGIGLLLAIRNPRYTLAVMTGTLGASMLASYVALSRPSSPYTSQNP